MGLMPSGQRGEYGVLDGGFTMVVWIMHYLLSLLLNVTLQVTSGDYSGGAAEEASVPQ